MFRSTSELFKDAAYRLASSEDMRAPNSAFTMLWAVFMAYDTGCYSPMQLQAASAAIKQAGDDGSLNGDERFMLLLFYSHLYNDPLY